MKTINLLLVTFLFVSVSGMAQTKSVDDIFNNFKGRDGVTSLNISKDMMGLAAQMDSTSEGAGKLLSQIGSVRILAFEKASTGDKALFNSLANSLPLSDYKVLMVVDEKNNHVKMLTRENRGKISEFLLLVTGDDNPAMISISGNIDPKEIGKLSSCSGLNGMKYLALLNAAPKK